MFSFNDRRVVLNQVSIESLPIEIVYQILELDEVSVVDMGKLRKASKHCYNLVGGFLPYYLIDQLMRKICENINTYIGEKIYFDHIFILSPITFALKKCEPIESNSSLSLIWNMFSQKILNKEIKQSSKVTIVAVASLRGQTLLELQKKSDRLDTEELFLDSILKQNPSEQKKATPVDLKKTFKASELLCVKATSGSSNVVHFLLDIPQDKFEVIVQASIPFCVNITTRIEIENVIKIIKTLSEFEKPGLTILLFQQFALPFYEKLCVNLTSGFGLVIKQLSHISRDKLDKIVEAAIPFSGKISSGEDIAYLLWSLSIEDDLDYFVETTIPYYEKLCTNVRSNFSHVVRTLSQIPQADLSKIVDAAIPFIVKISDGCEIESILVVLSKIQKLDQFVETQLPHYEKLCINIENYFSKIIEALSEASQDRLNKILPKVLFISEKFTSGVNTRQLIKVLLDIPSEELDDVVKAALPFSNDWDNEGDIIKLIENLAKLKLPLDALNEFLASLGPIYDKLESKSQLSSLIKDFNYVPKGCLHRYVEAAKQFDKKMISDYHIFSIIGFLVRRKEDILDNFVNAAQVLCKNLTKAEDFQVVLSALCDLDKYQLDYVMNAAKPFLKKLTKGREVTDLIYGLSKIPSNRLDTFAEASMPIYEKYSAKFSFGHVLSSLARIYDKIDLQAVVKAALPFFDKLTYTDNIEEVINSIAKVRINKMEKVAFAAYVICEQWQNGQSIGNIIRVLDDLYYEDLHEIAVAVKFFSLKTYDPWSIQVIINAMTQFPPGNLKEIAEILVHFCEEWNIEMKLRDVVKNSPKISSNTLKNLLQGARPFFEKLGKGHKDIHIPWLIEHFATAPKGQIIKYMNAALEFCDNMNEFDDFLFIIPSLVKVKKSRLDKVTSAAKMCCQNLTSARDISNIIDALGKFASKKLDSVTEDLKKIGLKTTDAKDILLAIQSLH